MGNVVIDSSAILSIVFMESDAEDILRIIEKSDVIFVSAASYTESAIVFDNRNYPYKRESDLDNTIASFSGTVVDLSHKQAQIARDAYRKFGKGRHAAKLNMGDCFSYALAKQLGLPLLYKGSDFVKTDIISAL